MKLLYLTLPLLGSLAIAQSLVEDDCQCPQVKCPASDTFEGCRCTNLAELRCKRRCPNYTPTKFKVGPMQSTSETCKCEEGMCVQAWPASCICANANKHACWKKCGGVKPAFQVSPWHSHLIPYIIVSWALSSRHRPTPTPTGEFRKVQICGGGRANTNICPTGYTCIDDPYKPGCGLACDQTGICVKDQLCGGFAEFKCPDNRQVCVDNPRDDCDPKNGGADCGGLCVWPPALRAA
ncbi:hypothetical protein BU25DRAFT_330635 [Macroventuria anomochaeta]|uniref:Uncharacterized protein n=1 Tax=Macroventuria anomochaeta TaxID=301207 RepID=A0ACB6SE14_9PLEO|nr:uncharacterized protein BU25DRAFT_330635 [Macroventuria anomochaeta]KAF2632525.1 hypothetical protein BU25DRAFT_330635 [Macroventuria anomochaeta]